MKYLTDRVDLNCTIFVVKIQGTITIWAKKKNVTSSEWVNRALRCVVGVLADCSIFHAFWRNSNSQTRQQNVICYFFLNFSFRPFEYSRTLRTLDEIWEPLHLNYAENIVVVLWLQQAKPKLPFNLIFELIYEWDSDEVQKVDCTLETDISRHFPGCFESD
jgi:hypothetical protein